MSRLARGSGRPSGSVSATEASHTCLVEHVGDVIWTADMNLGLTFVNSSVTNQRGYSAEEAVAQSARDALTPESFQIAEKALRDALRRERTGCPGAPCSRILELEMTRKDGSTLWVESNVTFLRDTQGRAVGLIGVNRDVTDRRRFRLLVENARDVIWTTDMDLRVTYISPSVTPLLGYTVEEAMALSPREILAPSSFEVVKRALAERPQRPAGTGASPLRTLELEYVRKDGSAVWTETSVRFLRGGNGRAVGILGVTRDTTERRQVEQMKADFVTLTTHQLRTPLTGIKWLLELAVGDAGISRATREHIRDATAAADRLIEIVNNLLDSATLETGTLNVTAETTHLGELTRSVMEELDPGIHDKGCQVSVSGAETIGTLMADPKLLRQAVLNLVSNAVKYTPPLGRLAIRMRREQSAIVWEIQDTGIGVPTEGRARLFQKFYRADNACAMAPEGTGLGLYLVRLIIERFGGRVWFQSEEGKGSTFGFTLPVEGWAR